MEKAQGSLPLSLVLSVLDSFHRFVYGDAGLSLEGPVNPFFLRKVIQDGPVCAIGAFHFLGRRPLVPFRMIRLDFRQERCKLFDLFGRIGVEVNRIGNVLSHRN